METYKSPVTLDGKVIGSVGFSRDITEKKVLEKNLIMERDRFEKYLQIIGETPPENNEIKDTNNFTLDKVVIPNDFCALENKTIGWIKDSSRGIVVSIERDGKIINNPNRNTAIELGDYLTIVADKKNLKKFIQEYNLK